MCVLEDHFEIAQDVFYSGHKIAIITRTQRQLMSSYSGKNTLSKEKKNKA